LGAVVVQAGRTEEMGRIALPASGFVKVYVRGEPEDLRLRMLDRDGEEIGFFRRESDHYQSPPLPDEDLVLEVTGTGIADQSRPVHVPCGETLRLDLELEAVPSRVIDLEIEDPAARPRTATVSLHRDDRVVWRREGLAVGDDGALRVRVSAEPGEYRLFARTNDGLEAHLGHVAVAPGLEATPVHGRFSR
jgi:hypothetical protein